MSSSGLQHLARTAYEAHRDAHPASLPPWEDATGEEQQAWLAAVSAVAVQTGSTLAEALPARPVIIKAGDKRHTFHAGFDIGRQGDLAISDGFASSRHARFYLAHGLWFVEDRGSTNGTWLNGRRIHGPQRLKKGDKLRIGHTVMTVVSALAGQGACAAGCCRCMISTSPGAGQRRWRAWTPISRSTRAGKRFGRSWGPARR